jgi:hypothetical protein
LIAWELASGALRDEPGKAGLLATRVEVQEAWQSVSDMLVRQKLPELAAHVRQFVKQMPPPLTEKEQLSHAILQAARKTAVSERFQPTR